MSNDGSWDDTSGLDLSAYIKATRDVEMGYGARLCRYALVQGRSGEKYFIWIVHHAAFDGFTMRITIDMVNRLYQQREPPRLYPYTNFIKHIMELDKHASWMYWTEQLAGATKASFPSLHTGSSTDKSANTRIMKKEIAYFSSAEPSITKPTILRAAWAILLARYCDSNDVCFGTTVSGRQAPVVGIESTPGPMVATVPVRVRLSRDEPIAQFLQKVQIQSLDMVPYEQFGLQNIAKLSPDAKDACNFSSLLVIQPMQYLTSTDGTSEAPLRSELEAGEDTLQNYFSYPLVLQAHVFTHRVQMVLIYDTAVLSELQMVALSHHFDNVVQQLNTEGHRQLDEVFLATTWDQQQALDWNRHDPPELISNCIHTLIEDKAADNPNAPAIRAWDKEFTYSQLDAAANRLAHLILKTVDIKANDLVHVCFEKSAWFFVSILAVNKAGGASVPLDPSHPGKRQQQVVTQTQARLALASESNRSLCQGLLETVIEVGPKLDEELRKNAAYARRPTRIVSPRDAAYVLFTSGSTGTPKGLLMEHGSVCTSQTGISKRLRLTSDVRMLQFASYVFDLCIGEIIAPLISGACICVPSEETRLNSLTSFIRYMKINWAFLTPAFVRTLRPEDVPTLELLLLAGEAVGRDILETWFGKVRLINGWGPAETCVFSTLHEWQTLNESPLTIGRPVGGFCWIVDPKNPLRLAPVGTIGEVVIQGPTLLREYLSDPKMTEASQVRSLPAWAPQRTLPSWDRFYKSGDLCSYNPDGTIEYSSRKDSQVKVRGLRVELSEIEHHVRRCFEGVRQVAVDVLRTETGANLVCYFCFTNECKRTGDTDGDTSADNIFLPLTADMQSRLNAMTGQLSVALPRYMIPAHFIHCQFMPLITSTKLDRNKLRQITAGFNAIELAKFSVLGGEKRPPETGMERRLQEIWAGILRLPKDSIGQDDNFLQIGGDSITAIQVVSMARDVGVDLSVKAVFGNPVLRYMATQATELQISNHDEVPAPAFTLLPRHIRELFVDNAASLRKRSQLQSGQVIDDAYPCTSLQEGLMALTLKQPGSYVVKYVYRLPEYTNLRQFQTAWEKTVEICGNLRTRIMLLNGIPVQAIVQEAMSWDDTGDRTLKSFLGLPSEYNFGYNTRLSRYALLTEGDATYFIWTAHHAIYDGWSMRITFDTFNNVYRGIETTLPPYSSFVRYLLKLDGDNARQFWAAQLNGAKSPSFPPKAGNSLSTTDTKNPSQIYTHTVKMVKQRTTSTTQATILRAAWALVLARYCDSDDICFGTTVSGRQAHVSRLEHMPGPTIRQFRFVFDSTVNNPCLTISNPSKVRLWK